MLVPSDDYFIKKFDSIKMNISQRLNLDLSQLNQLNITAVPPGDVTSIIDGNVVKFIDFGFIRDNINLIRGLLGTLLYLFLFYYHYRMAMKMIKGIDFTNGGHSK